MVLSRPPLFIPLAALLLSARGLAQPNRNCPDSCDALGTATSNWNVFSSVARLASCTETLLVSFNINNALDDPQTTVRLSACTSDVSSSSLSGRDLFAARSTAQNSTVVANSSSTNSSSTNSSSTNPSSTNSSSTNPSSTNPSSTNPSSTNPSSTNPTSTKSTSTISTGPAWLLNTSETVDVQLLSSGAGGPASSADISRAARALQQQLAAGKTISVAYSNGVAVGVYSGARIDKNSTNALLQQLIDTASGANTTILQLCGGGRNARSSLGVIASSNGLAAVQGALAAWNNATCATLDGASSSTIPTTVYQSPLTPATTVPTPVELAPRASATCRAIQVVSGDSCAALATECGITPAQFTSFNPSPTECSALKVGEWVCCSAGSLPDLTPKPSPNGTCFTYLIEVGDSCAAIAAAHSLTVDDIGKFNTDTWGWVGCGDLLADTNICLSTGKPPMPAPMSNAICGPQVPGSTPSASLALADYNQCVLQACCDIWGQCGTTSDFCTPSNSSTRAPGTAAPGQNGCVSNCGTDIIESESGPAAFMNIAYFEAFNWQRPCLNMEVTQISSDYTHIHFGFANLTKDYEIDIGDQQIQFQLFTTMTGVKRILSIGGWAFSTDPSTYNIFREGVTAANRDTLVSNIVNFVNQYGLDGVDIDWEYPGEPDIPGIPAGSADDGVNYVLFLNDLRTLLPSSATLSITAPSSYFYLKQFQIQATADFVDYIVFMTYDLHGQWDYNSKFTSPGCPTGNCLRSHVNLTETMQALSMITKAGVPSNQIAVGVASYGRSFQMVNPACTGPECLFTGPLSGAQPGPCTATPGYIANAELDLIISNKSIASTSFTDTASDSNILVWGDNWAAYMTDANKAQRTLKYQGLNFAGTADWAVDVQAFEPGSAPADGKKSVGSKQTNASEICEMTFTTSNSLSIPEAAATIAGTWSASGADEYLDSFLRSHDLDDWLLAFFEETVNCGDSKGGTTFDCGDVLASTCAAPNDCNTYCPPQAFFVHYSVWQLFHVYQSFYQAIVNSAVIELGNTINNISDTFAPPDTSESELLSVLIGVLGTAAGVGTFVGDFDLAGVGAAADGIAAFTAMFSDINLDAGGGSSVTEALDEILGSTLSSVFDSVNKTIEEVLNTGSSGNITLIESFFKNGAFLDIEITDYLVDVLSKGFTSTMNQYIVVQAMTSASSTGVFSKGYGFLYSTDEYNSESDCTGLDIPTMIWYNDTCIGFGTYASSETGGIDSTIIFDTVFMNGDLLAPYVHNITLAIINNYECYLNPTSEGTPEFPDSFNAADPLVYPPCFFNLAAYAIEELGF